jgi:hypothetical protein
MTVIVIVFAGCRLGELRGISPFFYRMGIKKPLSIAAMLLEIEFDRLFLALQLFF